MLDLYERFYGVIYGYCLRRLYLQELAEDATSATFLKLVENYDALRGKTRDDICKWLYGTASNAVAKIFREKKRSSRILAELGPTLKPRHETPAQAVGKMDWPVLYRAIWGLKKVQQDVVVLRYFEGFETNAIAEILDLKPVTVRVTLSRAVRKLRRNLEVSLGDS